MENIAIAECSKIVLLLLLLQMYILDILFWRYSNIFPEGKQGKITNVSNEYTTGKAGKTYRKEFLMLLGSICGNIELLTKEQARARYKTTEPETG